MFGWKPEETADPQARETFEQSKLNWEEIPHEPHSELLDWHRRLILLRRAEPALHDGRLERVNVHHDEQARWFVLERGVISVACNLAKDPQSVPLRTGKHRNLLASGSEMEIADGKVNLPPVSVAILKMD